MKRIFVVYNPRSSRHDEIQSEVLERLRDIRGVLIGKYEVEKTDVDQNVKKLSKLLSDDDIVIAVGGDATATIAANGILFSGKNVKLAVLAYGNFNDLARTLGRTSLDEIIKSESVGKLYPLEIIVNGRFFRYAMCYVTIGMMAEATEIFDQPKVRKKLGSRCGRKISSYLSLAKWYLKNRRRKFLGELTLNGAAQIGKITDYIATNGRSMARIMRVDGDYAKKREFKSGVFRLSSLWRLMKMMGRSIFNKVPVKKTRGDVIEFKNPSRIEIQAEGEYRVFENVTRVEIRKSEKYLKVQDNNS